MHYMDELDTAALPVQEHIGRKLYLLTSDSTRKLTADHGWRESGFQHLAASTAEGSTTIVFANRPSYTLNGFRREPIGLYFGKLVICGERNPRSSEIESQTYICNMSLDTTLIILSADLYASWDKHVVQPLRTRMNARALAWNHILWTYARTNGTIDLFDPKCHDVLRQGIQCDFERIIRLQDDMGERNASFNVRVKESYLADTSLYRRYM